MLGACSVSGLVMLDMAFVWGAEWNLVYDLHKLKGDNAIFDESGRHMKVRTELIGQAQALLGLAIGICALHAQPKHRQRPPELVLRHRPGAFSGLH